MAAAVVLAIGAPSKIAEYQVAGALRPYLEPTGSIAVRARTTVLAYPFGRINRLHIDARAIRLGDVTVERLTASLDGVTMTRSRGGSMIPYARAGNVTIEIGRSDLERFLRSRGVENPVVTINPDGVVATGVVRVGALKVAARVRGQFYASGPDIRFRATSVEMSGVEVPAALAGTIFGVLQPAVSLRELHLQLTTDSVSTGNGRIVVQAHVEGSPR